jgi:hypothetical protein
VPFVLRATGSTTVAGTLMVAYGFFLFAVFGYYAGGVSSPPSFWNALLPMPALALVGPRGAAFWTAAVLLEALGVGWLERHGLQLDNYVLPERRAMYWFVSISCLSALIVLAGLVYERTKNAAIRHLAAANEELARARDAADRAARRRLPRGATTRFVPDDGDAQLHRPLARGMVQAGVPAEPGHLATSSAAQDCSTWSTTCSTCRRSRGQARAQRIAFARAGGRCSSRCARSRPSAGWRSGSRSTRRCPRRPTATRRGCARWS